MTKAKYQAQKHSFLMEFKISLAIPWLYSNVQLKFPRTDQSPSQVTVIDLHLKDCFLFCRNGSKLQTSRFKSQYKQYLNLSLIIHIVESIEVLS